MQNGLFIVWNSHKKYLGVFNTCLLNKLFNFEIFILMNKIFLKIQNFLLKFEFFTLQLHIFLKIPFTI